MNYTKGKWFSHDNGTYIELRSDCPDGELLSWTAIGDVCASKYAEIDDVIAGEQYHVFEGSCLTVCCMTLRNGFTVTGESACASPENFNVELGRKIARENARNKIWQLEGYLLKQRLYSQ